MYYLFVTIFLRVWFSNRDFVTTRLRHFNPDLFRKNILSTFCFWKSLKIFSWLKRLSKQKKWEINNPCSYLSWIRFHFDSFKSAKSHYLSIRYWLDFGPHFNLKLGRMYPCYMIYIIKTYQCLSASPWFHVCCQMKWIYVFVGGYNCFCFRCTSSK